ncbi:hypothetical protein [Rubripirellula lacrimiformis]|uniref:hypothetical protein n=1 Tax=Rubripirellula lacrimiformis TaxID=1930273 RepID=UPI0011A60A3B|nr:hypothetical protein [Rubripirellula lacrimiformis]
MYNQNPNKSTPGDDFPSGKVTAIGGHPHRQYWRDADTDRILSVPAVTLVMADGFLFSINTETQQPLDDGDPNYLGWLPEGHDPRSEWYDMVPQDAEIITVDVSAPDAKGGGV